MIQKKKSKMFLSQAEVAELSRQNNHSSMILQNESEISGSLNVSNEEGNDRSGSTLQPRLENVKTGHETFEEYTSQIKKTRPAALNI